RLEPRFRGRNRAPGGGPPGRAPGPVARRRRPQPRHPGGDEGRRGPPRRPCRKGRRQDPPAADPDRDGRGLPADEDGGLPVVGAAMATPTRLAGDCGGLYHFASYVPPTRGEVPPRLLPAEPPRQGTHDPP